MKRIPQFINLLALLASSYFPLIFCDVFKHPYARALSGAPVAGEGATGRLFTGERIRQYSGHSAWKVHEAGMVNNSLVAPHERWVVITTVNSPTMTMKQIALLQDWAFVLVGDLSTPEPIELMHYENFVYLSPDDQEKLGYDILRFIPWKHFGRKNIGYLFAIEHGAKVGGPFNACWCPIE